jgi:hypothetical protein
LEVLRIIKCGKHVARMKKKIAAGKAKGKRKFGGTNRRWDINIRIDFT